MHRLEFKHISEGIESFAKFVDDRRKGLAKSLKTSKPKLNKVLLGGLDYYRILTIAGLPGSGKSTVLHELKRDFLTLNEDQDVEILSFDFEMRIEDTLARDVSSRMNVGVKELYSAETPLDDKEYEDVVEEAKKYDDKPMFYVDNIGTVEEILNTITYFAASRQLKENGKSLIVTIDHLLLTKGKTSESDKTKIDELMHGLVGIKQAFSSIGLPVVFICLSQLNRDIETPERIRDKYLHYPTKNDIFAASSIYQCSDYVLVTHKPADISGIIGYGPAMEGYPQGLPTMCPSDPDRAMIYFHLIKERFGDKKIISCVEDFKHSQIHEYQL